MTLSFACSLVSRLELDKLGTPNIVRAQNYKASPCNAPVCTRQGIVLLAMQTSSAGGSGARHGAYII